MRRKIFSAVEFRLIFGSKNAVKWSDRVRWWQSKKLTRTLDDWRRVKLLIGRKHSLDRRRPIENIDEWFLTRLECRSCPRWAQNSAFLPDHRWRQNPRKFFLPPRSKMTCEDEAKRNILRDCSPKVACDEKFPPRRRTKSSKKFFFFAFCSLFAPHCCRCGEVSSLR